MFESYRFAHWDQPRTLVKFQKSQNIQYWEMDEIFFPIKPNGKVKNTPKILNVHPANFSECFLSILSSNNISQQTQKFSRTSANWMYEWVLTPPSGLHTHDAIGKTNIVSDWQFEKTGCPVGSLKMPRACFRLVKIQL